MFCRAIFSEDGLEYEGELKEINVSDGHQYAIVEFLGYGNQETVWTDQLMESAGAKARKAQIDEALAGESEVAPAEKEEDVVVEKIEETEILAPKVQEFQSPEVEQPNDDEELEMQASAGGSSGLYQATPPLQGGQDLHDNDGHHQNQLGATNPNCLYDAQTCEDELEDKNQIIDEVLTKMEKFNSSDLSRVLTKVADLMKRL